MAAVFDYIGRYDSCGKEEKTKDKIANKAVSLATSNSSRPKCNSYPDKSGYYPINCLKQIHNRLQYLNDDNYIILSFGIDNINK